MERVTNNISQPNQSVVSGSFHGYNGEMTISSVPFKPLVKYFVTAAVELGYPIKDLNAPFDEGQFLIPDFQQY